MPDDAVCGPLLAEIRAYVARAGYPPSRRELRAALDVASTDTIARHMRHLARDGMIEIQSMTSRGFRLLAVEGGA